MRTLIYLDPPRTEPQPTTLDTFTGVTRGYR